MANGLMNIDKEVEYYASQVDSYDNLLGRGLMVPFNPSNSGSRKLNSQAGYTVTYSNNIYVNCWEKLKSRCLNLGVERQKQVLECHMLRKSHILYGAK